MLAYLVLAGLAGGFPDNAWWSWVLDRVMRQGRKVGEKDLCDCWSGWRVGGRSRMSLLQSWG